MNHEPVLVAAALLLLHPEPGETALDVTVGLGGHAKSFLGRIGSSGRLIGLDADRENLEEAGRRLHSFKNVSLIHANFRDLPSLSLPPCDILLADLGLSSSHIDCPERGFSFRSDAPLDCRYDRAKGRTAADLLAESSEEELLRMFQEYGELPRARRLVTAILEGRRGQPIRRTREFSELAAAVYGYRTSSLLPQLFQALRIAVNDELVALAVLLEHGPALLTSGGRMGIISYHSLEDRLVKRRFRELSEAERHPLTGAEVRPAPFERLTKKAIQAENQEVERNPRARSARMRAIGKLISTV